ncbi:MAG: antitoxin family protein [Terriglobia bacterium]
MTKSIEAVFDGVTLRPDKPLELPPNTRVRLTIESLPTPSNAGSFLRTARTLGLAGPRDWSSNLEDYLYGENADSRR